MFCFYTHSDLITFARTHVLAMRAAARPQPTPPPRHCSRCSALRVGLRPYTLSTAIHMVNPNMQPSSKEPSSISTTQPSWDSSQISIRAWVDDVLTWIPTCDQSFAPLIENGYVITSHGRV
eukprot:4361270-Pleurochrysis_carterae.AAC.1